MPEPYTDRLHLLRRFFDSGITRSYTFRKEQLKKLKASLLRYEKDIYDALYTDLKKDPEESWVTETGLVIAELNAALKNLHRWMAPVEADTNLLNFPSSSRILKEPLGVVLIAAPWNYPVQLLLNPLVGAMAAGNCVVLKSSEFSPATDAVMKQVIESAFPPEYILYLQGEGAEVLPPLMNNFSFDHVFYTGSAHTGRLIYKMAAERLVPVTLELGGKSPCVIERDANIRVAARRVAVTKFTNAGQMCVAPDYVLVHESKKDMFIEALKNSLQQFFSEKPDESDSYGKIINERQFNRIANYLQDGKIVFGGRTNKEKLFIEPSILTDVSLDAAIMKEEIFGPVLPVITFNTKEEAAAIIARNPNPLAFYIFTSSEAKEKEWLESTSFGGACVNNASWHLTNHYLPFGGRGSSGSGNYHGQYSFNTFSHQKAVMKTPTWFDPNIKYPPFKGKLRLFKWIVR